MLYHQRSYACAVPSLVYFSIPWALFAPFARFVLDHIIRYYNTAQHSAVEAGSLSVFRVVSSRVVPFEYKL